MPYLAKNTKLGKLEVLEIYEFYDIPRLFLCSNQYGHYYLVLSVSETDEDHTWIYAAISKQRLKAVRAGKVDLHNAFKQTEDACVFKVTTMSTEPDTVTTVMCDELSSEWLPNKGPKLDIPKSKVIPKGSHQIIGTPPLPGMQDAIEDLDDIIIRAFSKARVEVMEGEKILVSSDRVIADPYLDKKFIELCLKYGLKTYTTNLNLRLMALRKAKKLADLPPSKKLPGLTPIVSDMISFASELAYRLIRIRKGVTLDTILCDPNLSKEFDKLAKNISPGYSSLEYRLAALNVRKRGAFKWVDERVEFRSIENVKKVRIEKIPDVAGLYLFSSDDFPVFINQTDSIRNRLMLHLKYSNNLGLPDWSWNKPLQHSYIATPEITAKLRKDIEQTEIRERETFLNFYSKTA